MLIKLNKILQSKWSVLIMILFYLAGGINHFINPEVYYPVIPDYLPFPTVINYLSGSAEIILAIGIAFHRTRKIASYLIILMLIAFIPAHIHFLKIGSCIGEELCLPPWVGWMRLILIHPLLIYWAFMVGKTASK